MFFHTIYDTQKIQSSKNTDQWGKELPFIVLTDILYKWLPSALWAVALQWWLLEEAAAGT